MNFNQEDRFEYENGFYLTSDPSRFGRFIAHYELFKLISDVEGDIVECGVFKGASFMRFAGLVKLYNQDTDREIIGFDTFGDFPETTNLGDKEEREAFIQETKGGQSISKDELENFLSNKGITNYQLIKGDLCNTAKQFAEQNKNKKIALLNIDTDIYEPAVAIIEHLAPLVVPGGIIIFDDYGVFPGETQVADDYVRKHNFRLQKFPFSKVPYFLIKE